MRHEIIVDEHQLAALEGPWRKLWESLSRPRPTLSPDWLLTWWEIFGDHQGRQLCAVAFFEGDELVGLVPLLSRPVRRLRLIESTRIELLGSGEDAEDEICSDYIGPLAAPGWEHRVCKEVVTLVTRGALGRWNELVMSALDGSCMMPPVLAAELGRESDVKYRISGGAPYLALERSWDEQLKKMSSSKRYLLRNSARHFEAWSEGRHRLREVKTEDDLERGLEVLQSLHGTRWAAEGRDEGVFASERFTRFHREVTRKLLRRGWLWLEWLEVDGRPISALYLIACKGTVFFYQAGRVLDLPKKARVGIYHHSLAIQRAIAAGYREYDFLEGQSRYKLQLASGVRPLRTLNVRRAGLHSRLHAGLDAGKIVARALRDKLRRDDGRSELAG